GAWAVPSFARQTGMACEACHTVFPELNHFGRMFKANAYTVDNLKPVRGVSATREELLALSGLPPISLMVQVSQTSIAKAIPDGVGHFSQSSSVAFPQQISLFYAGKIAPRLGAFIQLTYANNAGTIGIDNTDLRWADNRLLPGDKSLVYGITANNNPTVQDLWNSTPAFGYPYAGSKANVSPIAGTQIDGKLGQSVAGVSLYAIWNEALYGEIGTYRSAKQGVANAVTGGSGPLDGTVSNVIVGGAPYYRIAYEYLWGRHSLSAGLYGATFKLVPGGSPTAPGTLSGPANEFRDTAEDFQYQFIGDRHLFSLAGTHIREKMTLNASYGAGLGADNLHDDLTTTRITGNYYYQRRYGATLGMFSTTGSLDTQLYPAGASPGVVTSASGLPDTKGWMAELNYMPWLNTRITLQDTQYTKFNGGGDNYDGFGRNAGDNNSLYLLVWFNY
ncbi:MAG: cytochrome C, partial [Gammaproteobacteria bacterium]|nr:cytochrome C [Gammaproteobacteria bacterium]